MKSSIPNLSKMVPANEAEKPYENMLLNKGNAPIKPIIKYGVNPATGIPLSNDFMASMVRAVGSVDSSASDPHSSVVVGERRRLIVDLFYVRAEMLFNNMVDSLNVQYDKELRRRFPDIYKKLSETSYSSWEDDANKMLICLFRTNMFSRDGYGMNYNSRDQTVKDVRNRMVMSKLVDLEYYMRVPLGTILDALLSPIADDYRSSVANINRVLMLPRNLNRMAIDYDKLIQFIGGCYVNLVACAETVVRVLYDEAMAMLEAGYPNKCGIEYDEFWNAYGTATRAAEAKLFADMAAEDIKIITE